MGRELPRDQRLRLFRAGNDRCPICMSPFTGRDVEQGEAVTLEHVPPRSFEAGGIAMCLTCSDCNRRTGRVEQVVIETNRSAARNEEKVQLNVAGLPALAAYATVTEESGVDLRISGRRDVTPGAFEEAFGEALRKKRPLTLKWRAPTPHYTSVPWLKAAYLSVFSLLGRLGYRYAEGEAVERVRRQILNPGDNVIPRFSAKTLAAPETDGIIASRATSCWAVKTGKHLVLLPRSWDRSFYERFSGLPEITVKGDSVWRPVKFGRSQVVSATVREDLDPMELCGGNLFGIRGELTVPGAKASCVLVDRSGQDITALIAGWTS